MKKKPRIYRRRQRSGGFALIVTITLMVLLALLAVGLLSLSTISLRTSTNDEALRVARNNARTALMLAIGQLQEAAGPDQRITAPANLVNDSFPPGFTGVWESWEPGEEGANYDGKNGRFKGWLTSSQYGARSSGASTAPHVAADDSNGVLLLGEGTLKDRTAGGDARMAVVPLEVEAGGMAGRMAWATIDESVKARVNLSEEINLTSPALELTRAGAPAADGIPLIDGFSQFEATDQSVARMISTASVDLGLGDDSMGEHAPDLTVWSASLLTDPVAGGLKRDLSTLFRNGLGAGEDQIRLYADAGLGTGESDPYLGLLASYHDLYLKIGESDAASPGVRPEPNGIVASPPPSRFRPVIRDVPQPQALEQPLLTPSVLRIDIIFSLIARDAHGGRAAALRNAGYPYMLHLMYLPVVTLHNPYNVPLSFESVRVGFQDIPIGFQFAVNGQPLTTSLIPLNGLTVSQEGRGTTTKEFNITLKKEIGGSSETMTLLPGQTKIFGTPKVPPTWTWDKEEAGQGRDGVALFDWRGNQTAEFDMAARMITPPTTSVGFDVDWLAPRPFQTPAGIRHGHGEGLVALRGTRNERISVNYAPVAPAAAGNAFTVSIDMVSGRGRAVNSGFWRINYENVGRLKEIVEQGTSLRFPEARSFPETYPHRTLDVPITVQDIYERNNAPISQYTKPVPVVIFSVSGKTTRESFIPSRPYADSSPAVGITDIDLAEQADSPGDVPLEIVMMPIRNGSSAIEEIRDTEEGFFFGGHGALNGSPRATFWEIPEVPLQSVAQFRHARLDGEGFHSRSTYTVGESLANPVIGTASTRGIWPGDNSEILDHTWLSNAALWDRYFLSTLVGQSGRAFGGASLSAEQQATQFFEGTTKLLNPRLTPVRPGDPTPADELGGADGWLKAAGHMMVKGGFNVNSTSVDAWTAVLAGLRGAEITTAGDVVIAAGGGSPMPRVRRPAEGPIDGEPILTETRFWQGHRQLSDGQIRELATYIVEEVRSRGPFLSLSEFVNRRLGDASDERALRGAIQVAIQRSDLNAIAEDQGVMIEEGDIDAARELAAPAAIYGRNAIHAPGTLSQGDVMSIIGSHVTVRGDTFVIRSYGDALDQNDRVQARAWCEAVVQRVPDFVDPGDPVEQSADGLNQANTRFGRRFEVVSFRWLSPDEV